MIEVSWFIIVSVNSDEKHFQTLSGFSTVQTGFKMVAILFVCVVFFCSCSFQSTHNIPQWQNKIKFLLFFPFFFKSCDFTLNELKTGGILITAAFS